MEPSIRTARRTLPLFVGAACLALALTGCAGEDSPAHARQTPRASTAPKPVPALSAAQAHDVITRYSEINNEANTDRDRRLLDTVEDGPLYAMSISDYTEIEGLPAADRKPYKPWSYDSADAKLYIPRLGGVSKVDLGREMILGCGAWRSDGRAVGGAG
ncbi:hypothetical protein ACFWDF_31475, partial [Streptomyces diastaticus]